MATQAKGTMQAAGHGFVSGEVGSLIRRIVPGNQWPPQDPRTDPPGGRSEPCQGAEAAGLLLRFYQKHCLQSF